METNYPTLDNYNKDEFEIIDTVLKKYNGKDTHVKVPYGVTEIYHAFFMREDIESVEIPNTVFRISGGAFCGCVGLTEIVIPDSVNTLGYKTFFGCHGLSSITLGKGLKTIERTALTDCFRLRNITVSPENRYHHSAGNCLIYSDTKTLLLGTNNSIIPDDGSVTEIGDYAFKMRFIMESITLPDTIESIGVGAFRNCKKLKRIVLPEGVKYVGGLAFRGCNNMEYIEFPNSVESIGEHALPNLGERYIRYHGTIERWKQVAAKKQTPFQSYYRNTIHCIDGDIQWPWRFINFDKSIKT